MAKSDSWWGQLWLQWQHLGVSPPSLLGEERWTWCLEEDLRGPPSWSLAEDWMREWCMWHESCGGEQVAWRAQRVGWWVTHPRAWDNGYMGCLFHGNSIVLERKEREVMGKVKWNICVLGEYNHKYSLFIWRCFSFPFLKVFLWLQGRAK